MAEQQNGVTYTSKLGDGKYNDQTQVKMWETEIIMHLQTLKRARKHPKSNQKSIEQTEGAIKENIMKIRQIIPDYKCPYTEDNVEEEVHSGFDPKKKKAHTEDTLGMQSKYSGEQKYIEQNGVQTPQDFENAKQNFLKSLEPYQSDDWSKQGDKTAEVRQEVIGNNSPAQPVDTDALFNQLNNIPESQFEEKVEEARNDTALNNDNIRRDINVEYDLVPLPSNGECYKTKKRRLSVSYLTAYDENMITSPNLYEGNLISEFLLKRKILDKDFNVMDLTKGDADAILVWLRKTGYGTEYPVTVTDRQTGKQFDTTVNLDDIKMVDFKLKSDENGLFDYHCAVCGANLKFRFMTLADIKVIESALKVETEDVRKNYVGILSAKIKSLVDTDKNLSDTNKSVLNESLNVIDKWSSSKSSGDYSFSNSVTDSLERIIVSVNGNDNKEYIKNFIRKMPALDSLKFRKYVDENEPRMDFTVNIERPADLGGGQMSTFLTWDKYVFANTSNL